ILRRTGGSRSYRQGLATGRFRSADQNGDGKPEAGASRWRRHLQRRESDDLYLQSARCTEGARDPSGVFWRQPTGKHALRATRPRQSNLPVGDGGNGGRVEWGGVPSALEVPPLTAG